MDKLKMGTTNCANQNYYKLAEMFPNAITETVDSNGHIIRAIDADILEQEINSHVVKGSEERYQFTWPGKRQAMLIGNMPTSSTLRPCIGESVGRDGMQGGFDSENLYIEGDNLEVLKLLQETYLGKVKMIYIDPPYNTGSDFVYSDNYTQGKEEYISGSGQYDENGGQLVQNLESNGRFHTDWLNMLYPRLKAAKNLLSNDGVIFVSIDDHEQANLRKICDELYGAENFEGHIHWRRRHNQPNDRTKMIGLVAEHIIVYAKNSSYLRMVGVGKIDLTATFSNPDNDPKGPWASKPWKVGSDQSGSKYTIITPSGKCLVGEWMGEESTYRKYLDEGRIYFPKNGDGMPRKKYYEFERENEGQCASNWWPHEQFGHNQGANDKMTDLFGRKNIFSNPKPVELLRAISKIANVKNNDIVLDFFSGSATTAHAVMQLNAEDGGNRKFIMVQLPEETPEKSEARKAGYKNICEIGKERIRRAGAKIKAETGADIDYGFRVLKCDSSNMKPVYYAPADTEQEQLDILADNIKQGRTGEDLLFQVMLELGVPLSSTIESIEVSGQKIFDVGQNYLLACFDLNVTEASITEIAKRQPAYFVMRDRSMANDTVAANFEQIFRTYSPDTVRKVL